VRPPLNGSIVGQTVIVEHEVIEQIEDEPEGRPLAWLCDLIRRLGRSDPLVVLQGMWRAGHVTLVDDTGRALPQWTCTELFRDQRESGPVRVVATSHRSR
jgi:hypothetical protein